MNVSLVVNLNSKQCIEGAFLPQFLDPHQFYQVEHRGFLHPEFQEDMMELIPLVQAV